MEVVDNKAIEEVARGLCSFARLSPDCRVIHFNGEEDYLFTAYLPAAKEVAKALDDAGYVPMPKVETKAMINGACKPGRGYSQCVITMAKAYKAMITAHIADKGDKT